MAARIFGVGMINGKILLVAATLTMTFMLVLNALAQECPAGVKSCKILILTPDEEATLSGPEMILDHAVWANRVKFESLARAWRDKIQQAPAGVVKPADANANPAKKQDKLPEAKK